MPSLLALAGDPEVTALAAAPGNAGTAALAEHPGLADATSAEQVVALARELARRPRRRRPRGPARRGRRRRAARRRHPLLRADRRGRAHRGLEGVRQGRHGRRRRARPRAARRSTTPADLDAALARFDPPWVVKDDGLAAGKGVLVTADLDAAAPHAAAVLEGGHPVLLESFLDGPEASLFCVVDGTTVVPLLPAQDFKRLGDDDAGPNTGGMGAYAPLPWAPDGPRRRHRRAHRHPRRRPSSSPAAPRSPACSTPGSR